MADDAWLALLQASRADTGRPDRWIRALEQAGSAEALAAGPAASLAAFEIGREAARLLAAPDAQISSRWRRWLAESPVNDLVTYGSPRYPAWLARSTDPPLALWVRGKNAEILAAPQLAIVGSRNPTAGGRQTAADFARELSGLGLTVTSGLASGIDAAAHEGALAAGGATVAVLGCGIDLIYPQTHRQLADAVIKTGMIVSEYPPGTPVRAFQFPQRNRIIAGLSLGTLVVEATRRSGALITARFAGDYGREVFAVPGSIHNPLARGCHRLLRDGAKLVEEVGDILVEIAASIQLDPAARAPAARPGAAAAPDPEYDKLLKTIGFDGVGIDDLAARTGLTPAELSSMLLVLELEGQVEALPGGRYALLAKRS